MFDEHILNYSEPGDSGECELVIGLDFGTSASKVVVQAPDLHGGLAYVVDFGEFAHASMACLLPSRLWVAPDGKCTLTQTADAHLVTDIKLELLSHDERLRSNRGPTGQKLQPTEVAVAYLALLLRYTRRWLLESKRDVFGHFERFNWSVNLGVPSPCVEDNEENRRFRLVGKAAWMLSVLEQSATLAMAEEEICLLNEVPEYWERDDDGLACDFEIVPEISAGAVGYALSTLRREGVHLMIDVGASTMDVCGFFLLDTKVGDKYSLLTADVRQLGTVRLLHERVRGVHRFYEQRAQVLRDQHDPLAPISGDLEPFLATREEIAECVQRADAELRAECHRMLRSTVGNLKRCRAPNEKTWKERLPVLVIGGGSRLAFFASLAKDLGYWMIDHIGNEGTLPMSVPVPQGLEAKTGEYHRLAVAWGLSHRAADIGGIVPADGISDIEPPAPRSVEAAYVSKDQV